MIFKLDQLPWVKLKLQVCWYVRKLLASNPNLGGVILAWSTTEFRIYTTIIIKTKVVLAIHSRVCSASIEITTILIITINMEKKISFFIPFVSCNSHTHFPDCSHMRADDKFLPPRVRLLWYQSLNRGSQVICIYCAICVVSSSSSPVSRVISEPKEVRSFQEVCLPIWVVTADGLVVIRGP